MTTASPAPLDADTVEKIMKEIEIQDGPQGTGTVASPNAPVEASATVAGADKNPLALREFVDADQLKKDVDFSVHQLDEAATRQASMFAHYANLARMARRQYERMKAAFEILESRLDAHYRTVLKMDGSKVTDKAIEAAVKADPRWWAGQQRLIDAKAIMELAIDAKEAFSQRRDMIIQMGADRREERKGELRIREIGAGRDSVLEHLRNQQGANKG